jgi:hypothetical protein
VQAKREDWKTVELPATRKSIDFAREYSFDEFEKIKLGAVPQSRNDQWFFFYEEPWLYCHRRRTGHCIWQVRFEVGAKRARVFQVLTNRDPAQCKITDDEFDMLMLASLLDPLAGRTDQRARDEFLAAMRKRKPEGLF